MLSDLKSMKVLAALSKPRELSNYRAMLIDTSQSTHINNPLISNSLLFLDTFATETIYYTACYLKYITLILKSARARLSARPSPALADWGPSDTNAA